MTTDVNVGAPKSDAQASQPEKPATRRVRYSGVSGTSVTNDFGTWNINAPDLIPDTQTPHPFAPVKTLHQRQADLIVDNSLFYYDDI